MYKQRTCSIVIQICLCFIFVAYSFADEECDKTKCPGPLQFYKDLKCKEIKKHPEDCCAIKYDCSHLEERSKSKCYINNNVYEIGEKLKEEDAMPCDIGCFCGEGHGGIATFVCAAVDCYFGPPKIGCYRQYSADQCCPSEVCPETLAMCLVDGKNLTEGDYFQPENQPELSCNCKPGYKGENVEPFCSKPKSFPCRPELSHSYEIREKCAPAFYSDHSPQTSCSFFYRCQNQNDTLISHPEIRENPEVDKSSTCTYGNIEMLIGDELNQATDYSSVCLKCVCEVPPIPTCQRLPDNECDVTVHPNFN